MCIRDRRYAKLYDVDWSYLLINGTSGGILASILASVPEGGKLVMARNCHKSVFNALTLGNIQPVYAYPEMIREHGLSLIHISVPWAVSPLWTLLTPLIPQVTRGIIRQPMATQRTALKKEASQMEVWVVMKIIPILLASMNREPATKRTFIPRRS